MSDISASGSGSEANSPTSLVTIPLVNMSNTATVPTTNTATAQTTNCVIKTSDEVNSLINSVINDKNAVLVKKDITTKNNQLLHYQKVLAKTKQAQQIANIISVVLGIVLGITTTILGFLIDYNYIKNTIATEIINMILIVILIPGGIVLTAYFQNKINNWNKVIADITKCIDQVYVFWKKATYDNVISDDEYATFEQIFNSTDAQVTVDANTSGMNAEIIKEIEAIFSNVAGAIQTLKMKI